MNATARIVVNLVSLDQSVGPIEVDPIMPVCPHGTLIVDTAIDDLYVVRLNEESCSTEVLDFNITKNEIVVAFPNLPVCFSVVLLPSRTRFSKLDTLVFLETLWGHKSQHRGPRTEL